MLFDVCEYIASLNMPSIQNVLRQLEASQICTGTQCFETVDDLVPMEIPTSSSVATHQVYAFLAAAFIILAWSKPTRTVKHGGAGPSVDDNHPPPPLS